jgi:hypothetical protein
MTIRTGPTGFAVVFFAMLTLYEVKVFDLLAELFVFNKLPPTKTQDKKNAVFILFRKIGLQSLK